jgi:hypothetical protein
MRQGNATNSQGVAIALWACAKLQQQPSSDELQLLVQTFLRPHVLAAAEPQHMTNTLWACAKLQRSHLQMSCSCWCRPFYIRMR